ncbi:hypothetical protein [Streptococcus loxodontisalivarius]|uniref:Glucan-binding repeat-containing protein n=1 Tax=Streptococcus loxodontisalivarius TaxID=1349415 RepID=A0ABS2PRK8_9STRE|nr:hypothetical protein [Streptococcus loxodontisalivarius]MBM7642516.1 glucan-binding repeat-containing protein [Streptococcus loxodontisalivarius]
MGKKGLSWHSPKRQLIGLTTVTALSLFVLSHGITTYADETSTETDASLVTTVAPLEEQTTAPTPEIPATSDATSQEPSTTTANSSQSSQANQTTETSDSSAIVTEAETTTSQPSTEDKSESKQASGWKGTDDGKWYYYDDKGNYLTGQQTIDGKEYYFNKDGSQLKGGSVIIDGTTYFADEDTGILDKGQWVSDGQWRYPSGEVDYYWAYTANGKKITGFQTIDGKEYYFYSSGRQAKGYLIENEDNSYSYFDGNSGEKVYGPKWVTILYKFPRGVAMTKQAYIDEDGKAVDGLQVINGKTYYFTNNTLVTSQNQTINGVDYYFDRYGVGTRLSNPDLKNTYYTENGKWYYAGEDGKAVTGAQTIDGVQVYFNDDGSQVKGDFEDQNTYSGHYYDPDTGAMWTNRFVEYKGDWYYLDEEGETVRGPQVYNDTIIYFDTDGKQIKGEMTYQRTWTKSATGNYFYMADNNFAYYYYDAETGARAQSQYIEVEPGHWYYFDENGKRVSGAQTIDGQDVYFNKQTGIQVKGGFVTIDGNQYYYDKDSGARVKNETRTIDDVVYTFDANGVASKA